MGNKSSKKKPGKKFTKGKKGKSTLSRDKVSDVSSSDEEYTDVINNGKGSSPEDGMNSVSMFVKLAIGSFIQQVFWVLSL